MKPLELIDKYYAGIPLARRVLLAHSHQVARFAVAIAKRMEISESGLAFIEEAALLHDIGILFTTTPDLGCFGDQPYIRHGILGAELLQKEGLHHHAMVCERHIGVGLTIEDIKKQGLPLPLRDMSPQSLAEKIIAYADLFYSKTEKGKRTADTVRSSLVRHGEHKVEIFDTWHKLFSS